ncbi:N-acetylmuramoyl-L-alanine amidase [Glycocaulis albus]|nr:N-acetylmuramoyl-L-alanine amidase [Glycocaulis albus]
MAVAIIKRLSGLKACMAALLAMAAGGLAHANEIIAVRFGVHDTHTRIVIETRSEMEFRAFASGEVTPRLIVDIPGAGWAVGGLDGGQGQGHGLAGRFRFEPAAQTPRLIFDLTESAQVRESFTLPPGDGGHRIVIDIEPAPAALVTASSGFDVADHTLTQYLAERVQVSYVPPRCERPRIVIDPGHGGRDPGAPGRFGSVSESHLALAAGLALRDILNARGRYEVIMTRDRDIFLELDERIQVARRAQADLFISLHADAAPNSATGPRGAAVYTLSDSGTNRARNRARQDGEWLQTSAVRTEQVNNLLLEMSLQEKRNQSLIFAASILEASSSITPLFRREPLERGFWVLLDSQIPAVLFEMGFMTNPDDSRNLNTPAYRQRLMTAVADSIDSYFAVCNSSGAVRTAAAGSNAGGPALR